MSPISKHWRAIAPRSCSSVSISQAQTARRRAPSPALSIRALPMPLGNADIDIAPTVDEQRFHAFGPGRLAGAGGVAIGRRLQNVGGFESGDRHALGKVFFLV